MFPSKVKPSKKPRLCIFDRDSYVSDSALSKLIKEFKEEGLPDADSRNSISRDRKAYINERTQFGPISNIVKGVGVDAEDIDVPVANPFAFSADCDYQVAAMCTAVSPHARRQEQCH